jgi:prolyl 4-hydroxylase
MNLPRITEFTENMTMLNEEPQVVLIKNFATPEECAHVIEMARNKTVRSKTQHKKGIDVVSDHRTSSSFFPEDGKWATETLKHLDDRIMKTVNWKSCYTENWSVMHYLPGQYFKPHLDINYDGEEGMKRVGTMITYLNDVEKGGTTTFGKLRIKIAPKMGDAVFFNYSRDNIHLTLHSGDPVVVGEKWILTRWLREDSVPTIHVY